VGDTTNGRTRSLLMAVESLPGALLVATQAGTIVAVNRAIE
jgi:hypothetical protein